MAEVVGSKRHDGLDDFIKADVRLDPNWIGERYFGKTFVQLQWMVTARSIRAQIISLIIWLQF